MKRTISIIFLFFSLFLNTSLFAEEYGRVGQKGKDKPKPTFVVVSKNEQRLWVFDTNSGKELASFPISCGSGYGNKETIGDNRTPEGVFHVYGIEDPTEWTFDFKDGRGPVKGVYGPLFIRLDVPGNTSIGIHGTNKPESIPGRNSSGCVRLHNEDVIALSKMVQYGTVVIITPSREDQKVINTTIEVIDTVKVKVKVEVPDTMLVVVRDTIFLPIMALKDTIATPKPIVVKVFNIDNDQGMDIEKN